MKMDNRAAVIGLSALILGAGVANAAKTDGAAVDACSDAIATYIEERQGVAPELKVDQSGIDQGRRLARYTVFELDAYDASTRNVVGRFTCMVNGRAEVKKLVTLPLDTADAARRSRG